MIRLNRLTHNYISVNKTQSKNWEILPKLEKRVFRERNFPVKKFVHFDYRGVAYKDGPEI